MIRLKRILSYFGISLLGIGLIATLYLTLQRPGAFETRRKAAELSSPPLLSLNFNTSDLKGADGETPTKSNNVSYINGGGIEQNAVVLSANSDLSYSSDASNFNKDYGTLELWFKPTTWQNDGQWLHRFFDARFQCGNNGCQNYMLLDIDSNKKTIAFKINDDAGPFMWDVSKEKSSIYQFNQITYNQWHHLAATWDKNNGTNLYFDGKIVAQNKVSYSLGNPIQDLLFSDSTLFLGLHYGPGSTVDDIIIYNYPKSVTDIAQDYAAYSSTPTPISNPFPAQQKVDTSNLVVYQTWLNYYPNNPDPDVSQNATSQAAFDNAATHLQDLHDMGVTMIQLSAYHPFYNVQTSMTTIGSHSNILDFYAVNPGYTGPTPYFITNPTFPAPTLNPTPLIPENTNFLKSYIQQAHNLGMKVLLDCIFHSTSDHSPLIAAHPDFYRHENNDPNGKLIYLPDHSSQVELNFTNPAVVDYMIDMAKYWVKTVDLDGCRVDIAAEDNYEQLYYSKHQSFWAMMNNELKKIKPTWFQVAEDPVRLNIWAAPFSGPGYKYNFNTKDGEFYSNVYSFDALLGVNFMDKLRNSVKELNDVGGKFSASKLQDAWTHPDQDPKHTNDLPPAGTIFYRYEDNSDQSPRAEVLNNNPPRKPNLPGTPTLTPIPNNSAMLAGMAVNFTIDGIPFIFNGQEIGDTAETSVMTQTFIKWKKPLYPDNKQIFKDLIIIRKTHPALMKGSTTWYTTDKPASASSYLRQQDNDKVLVVVNFSSAPWTVTVTGTSDNPLAGTLTPLYQSNNQDKHASQPNNNKINLTLEPWGYLIASLGDVPSTPTPTPTPLLSLSFDQNLNGADGEAPVKQVNVTTGGPGRKGFAANLFGGSQLWYSLDANNFNKDSGTLEFWFKPVNWNTDGQRFHRFLDVRFKCDPPGCMNYMILDEDQTAKQIIFTINDSQSVWSWENGAKMAKQSISSVTVTPDEWHHLGIVWDKDKGSKIYYDGTLAGQNLQPFLFKDFFSPNPTDNYSGFGNIVIANGGFTPQAGNLYPESTVDEYNIYGYPKTDAQIAADYQTINK